jgi:hypothetical protein
MVFAAAGMKKRVLVYWILPASAEAEFFRSTIGTLAEEHRAPVFPPHLTLCRPNDIKTAHKVLEKLEHDPIRLRILELTHSPKFTKTVFVRFAASKRLDKLVGKVGGLGAPPDPHLSLLYKNVPAAMREQLCRRIELPFRYVCFDAIALIDCVSPTETARDVQSWREIARTYSPA